MDYRWVVTGPSAEISLFRITKPAFNKGQAIGTSIEIVGSADLKTEVKAQLEVSVLADNKVIAENKSDFVTLNSRPKKYSVDLGLQSDATNPVVRARIIDEKGNILDEANSQITGKPTVSPTNPTQNNEQPSKKSGTSTTVVAIVIALAAIVAIVLAIVFRGKKEPTIVAMLIVFAVILEVVLGFSNSSTIKAANANPTPGFTCTPPLNTSGNAATLSPIDCQGYNSGTWTSHYECWQPNRTNPVSRYCSGDVIYPQSRIFINEADLDNSYVSTLTNGKYLAPVTGKLTTVACNNSSYVDYYATASISDAPASKAVLADKDWYRGGTCGNHACQKDLKNFVYTAAFNSPRTPDTRVGQIIFNIKDIFCGTGSGSNCSGEHEFTETFSVNIEMPVPLSCSANPSSSTTNTPVTISAIDGGKNVLKYQWLIDGTAVQNENTSTLNTSFSTPGTKTIKVKQCSSVYTATEGPDDPFQLATLLSNLATQKGLPYSVRAGIPIVRWDNGSGGGFKWNMNGTVDPTNVDKVCEILGYDTYVSSTCYDNERSGIYPNGKCNYHSPSNDSLQRYKTTISNFALENGQDKYKKTWIASITCADPLPPTCDQVEEATCTVEVTQPQAQVEVTVDGTVVNDLGSAPGFGNVGIGSTTTPKSVRVNNIGTVPVVFRAGGAGAPSAGTPRTLGGWDNSNFRVNDTPALNTLAPGESVEYATVAFSPVSQGAKSGILAIQYDRLGADFLTKVNRVSFSGTGISLPTAELWIVQPNTADHSKTTGTVALGGSVKLGWNYTNAESCTFSTQGTPGGQSLDLAAATKEIDKSGINAQTTYNIQCFKDAGGGTGYSSPIKSVTINVQGSVPGGNIREL